MNGHRWMVGAVLSISVAATGVHAQEKTVPEIWKTLEREADSIAKMDKEVRNYEVIQVHLDGAAREIADHRGRSDIETMVRSVGNLPRPLRGRRVLNALSIRVLVEVADPKGEHGLKELGQGNAGWETM